MDSRKVIRVTKSEFELEDGRVFQHPVELDDVLSVEEFQAIYDRWRVILLDEIGGDREAIDVGRNSPKARSKCKNSEEMGQDRGVSSYQDSERTQALLAV